MIEGFRVSPQQQLVWALQNESGGSAQTVSARLVFRGPIDDSEFQKSLSKMVARHEILRTVFTRIGGLQFPVQVVRDDVGVWLTSLDLRDSRTHSSWSEVLAEVYGDFRRKPWNFAEGPLVQAQIVGLPENYTAVIVRASRLCTDRTGLWNVLSETLKLYSGNDSSLDEPAAQYADIAEYLNEALESESTPVAQQFWDRWKEDMYPPLRIGAAAVSLFAEGCASSVIDPTLAFKIEELATRAGSAVADVILTCWQIVLSRYFHQEQFTIGLVSHRRDLDALSSLPGAFEKILPMPCWIKPAETFEEQVARNSHARREVLQWQDYLAFQDCDRLTAVFDLFVPQPLPEGTPELLQFLSDETLYPHHLRLLCAWDLKLPTLHLGYSPSCLSAAAADALLDQLGALLNSTPASPLAPIRALSALSPTAQQRLLQRAQEPTVAYSETPFVHTWFESQARQDPQRIAVSGNRTLTYGELDGQASRLARVLRARGVGPESAVAICLDRSVELLVAMLGVLKAGGYYIPLDPGYPSERLEYVLRDSRSVLVLADSSSAAHLPALSIPVIDVAGDLPREAPSGSVSSDLHPLNLAYAIYTSGSTGLPKGVAISHSALANYLEWCRRTYGLENGNGVIAHTPIGFDLTVTTLLAPLCAGQRVILIKNQSPVEELAQVLRANANYTLLKLTPSHMDALNELVSPAEFNGAVQTVVIGGEALFGRHLIPWKAHAAQTRLVNEYGPTEATVGCANYEIDSCSEAARAIPIGAPIANAGIYVLDSDTRLAPINTAGELYVSGACLARGYLGKPALTAEHFLPDPYSQVPGQRIYETGDRGRYDAEGVLHFIGRKDEQIKLRGYRIELTEIENVLRKHDSVADAAAVLRERGEQRQLLAYVTAVKGGIVRFEELRSFLSAKLPEYMVPSQILVLDRFPLTFHGKVDKGALPDPDHARDKFDAPRNGNEQLLAELWAKAFGVERVSIHEDFFELGGDSIISIQIVNRARRHGLVFTPRQLFRARTIAALASVATRAESTVSGLLQRLMPASVEFTPIHRWFFEQNFKYPDHWNQAVLLEANDALDAAALEQAVAVLASRHDSLRLRFACGSDVQARLSQDAGGSFVVTLDLAGTESTAAGELMNGFASGVQASLNLSTGPLMKAGLIRVPGERDRLLLVLHHVAVDVVSWSILITDLSVAYRQITEGSAVSLPPGGSSFQQWSLRLSEYAQSEKVKRELDYWMAPHRRFRKALPVDFASGSNLVSSQDTVWCGLGKNETLDLVQQAPKKFHTMINDVLLTALVQAFYEWTNERSITIDLENHGREELFNEVDVSRTVGWFTCIFPITLTLASTYDSVANLRAVKEEIRSIADGGIAYGLLRYVTQDRAIREDMARAEPPQISFNYVGRAGQMVEDRALFSRCQGALGATRNPLEKRPFLLEVTGSINLQGELRMAFIYSRDIHREETIRRLAQGFEEALRDLVSVSRTDVPPLGMGRNGTNNWGPEAVTGRLDMAKGAGE